MNWKVLPILLSVMCVMASANRLEKYQGCTLPEQFRDRFDRIDQDVLCLLADLTLEEKAGQMAQLDIVAVLESGTAKIDTKQLAEYLDQYYIGSLLDTPFASSAGLVNSDQWRSILTDIQTTAAAHGSKIPIVFGLDSVHGANYISGATLFPQQIGGAATFNPTLLEQQGAITAKDTRAVGIPWIFAPILDLALQPSWARVYETFGEDPYLASVMGVAVVSGIQGLPANLSDPSKAAATAKHFIGYSNPRSGHDRTPAWIPDRFLYEYYVPSFRAAIQAEIATVMETYGEVNGVPVCSSNKYLKTLLRDTLKFNGTLVTDFGEVNNLHYWHKIVPSVEEAVHVVLNQTTVDMSMALDLTFPPALIQLVRSGVIPESRVDDSVARLLQFKKDLGLFANPLQGMDSSHKPGNDQDRLAALNSIRESITLLQNAQVLPLTGVVDTLPHATVVKSVLVTGPAADSLSMLAGGWTFHWQGPMSEAEFSYGTTLLQGIQKQAGPHGIAVNYAVGCAANGSTTEAEKQEVLTKASSSDVVIIALGEHPYAEKPGDIEDLMLAQGQLDLLSLVITTGKPVVLVLLEGRPRLLGNLTKNLAAVVHAYLPGPDGGQGIAEVLFGVVNPSGRLPISYPQYPAATLIPYWHKPPEESAYNPLWPFGTGLSYSKFSYTNLVLSTTTLTYPASLTVTVTVTNLGPFDGKESVLVYLSDTYRIITPEVKRLRAFTKIALMSGASQVVSLTLPAQAFEFVGPENTVMTEAGEFVVHVGDLSATLNLVVN